MIRLINSPKDRRDRKNDRKTRYAATATRTHRRRNIRTFISMGPL
jgi:hypothetical protein